MASSSEPTDIPIQLHTGAIPQEYTEVGWLEMTALVAQMEKATRLLTSMGQEIDKLRTENARLKHQLAIIRRHP